MGDFEIPAQSFRVQRLSLYAVRLFNNHVQGVRAHLAHQSKVGRLTSTRRSVRAAGRSYSPKHSTSLLASAIYHSQSTADQSKSAARLQTPADAAMVICRSP